MLLFTTLALWLFIGLQLLGIGTLVQITLREHLSPLSSDGLRAFWLGWAGMLAGLQLYHLFWSIDSFAWSAWGILALVGLVIRWRHRRCFDQTHTQKAIFFLLLLAASLFLALRVRGVVENYDTGLYHLDSVRWIQQYAIVPGLGNLHGRLAFNSSHFLYCALCDVNPLAAGKGPYFAHGLLILLLLATGINSAVRLFLPGPSSFTDIYFASTLVPTLKLSFSPNVNGFSPDLAVFVLSLYMLGTTIRQLEANPSYVRPVFLSLAVFFFAGCTIKPNFVFFGGPLFTIATLHHALRFGLALRKTFIMHVFYLSLIGLILFVPWLTRGVIMSGYPAYPLTFGALPVDWKIPAPICLTEAIVISTWAREPGSYWANIGLISDWFPGWLSRQPLGFKIDSIVALALSLVCLLTTTNAHPLMRRRWQVGLILACVTSIVAWFMVAPDPRFLGASLPSLTILCGLFILTRLQTCLYRYKIHLSWIILSFIVAWGAGLGLPDGIVKSFQSYRADLPALPSPDITNRITTSGLVINLPRDGQQTWGMSLPATHLFREDLTLRTPNLLAHGFRVSRPLEYLDGVGRRADADLITPMGFAGRFLDGWSKPKDGTRSMQTPSRILLYAPRSCKLKLQLNAGWIDVGGQPSCAQPIALYVQDHYAGSVLIRHREATTMTLFIRKGFNLVVFTEDQGPRSSIVFRRIMSLRGGAIFSFQYVKFLIE